MVAILVVFVILTFLTIDHLVARAELGRHQQVHAPVDQTGKGIRLVVRRSDADKGRTGREVA